MGKRTHGPRLLTAIENNDLAVVSDILSRHFRNKDSIKEILNSSIPRLDSSYHDVPLLLASRLTDLSILKYMITKHSIDINTVISTGFHKQRKSTTCLIEAVRRGHHECAEEMLIFNADSNLADHKSRSPLHHAVKRADVRMVCLLLGRGAQCNATDILNNTPMHMAAYLGHTELLRLLVSSGGADLYKPGHGAALPLHLASAEGHTELVCLMVGRFSVNPNIKGSFGDRQEVTALHVACLRAQTTVISSLLDQCGADLTSRDAEGETPMHSCLLSEFDSRFGKTKEDYFEAVRLLISYSVDLNLRNSRGETALHLAARNEFQSIIELLLLSGSDPSLQDNDGNRPLDLVLPEDTVSRLMLKSAFEDRAAFIQQTTETRSKMSESFANLNASKLNISQPSFLRMNSSRHNISLYEHHSPNSSQTKASSFIPGNLNHSKDALSPVPSSNGYLLLPPFEGKPPSSLGYGESERNRLEPNSGSVFAASRNGSRNSGSVFAANGRRINGGNGVKSGQKKNATAQSFEERSNFSHRTRSVYSGSGVTSLWDVTPSQSVYQTSVDGSVNQDRNGYNARNTVNTNGGSSDESFFDDDSFDSISELTKTSSEKRDSDKYGKATRRRLAKTNHLPIPPKRNSSSSNTSPKYRRVPPLPVSPEVIANGYANMDNVDRMIEIELDKHQTNIWDIIRLTSVLPPGQPPTKIELIEKNGTAAFVRLLNDGKFVRRMVRSKFSVVNCLKIFSDYNPSHYMNESSVDLNKYVPHVNCDKYVLKKCSQAGRRSFWKLETARKEKVAVVNRSISSSSESLTESSGTLSDSLSQNESIPIPLTSIKKRITKNGPKKIVFEKACDNTHQDKAIMQEYLFNKKMGGLSSLNVDEFIDNMSVNSTLDDASTSRIDNYANLSHAVNYKPGQKSKSRLYDQPLHKQRHSRTHLIEKPAEQEYYEELSSDQQVNQHNSVVDSDDVGHTDVKDKIKKRICISTENNNLGFSFIGGNISGIFIDAVHSGSSAEKSGLKPQDQLVSINGKYIEGKSAEEVSLSLSKHADHLELLLQAGEATVLEQLRNNNITKDLFYVRALFSRASINKDDFVISVGDIFCVSDSLPADKPGNWSAKKVYAATEIKNEKKLVSGFIPNSSVARRILERVCLEKKSSLNKDSNLRRSFRRSKSNEKLSPTSILKETSKFSKPYERVLQVQNLRPRPIAILGLFAEQIREKLTADSPGLFEIMPVKLDFSNHGIDEAMSAIARHVNMATRRKKHCLLRVDIQLVKLLRNKGDEDALPIVVFLKPSSNKAVKEMALNLAPEFAGRNQAMFEELKKFEKEEASLFDGVVRYNESAGCGWFDSLKETIRFVQKQERWITVDLVDDEEEEDLDRQRLSKTTDDLPSFDGRDSLVQSPENNMTANKKFFSKQSLPKSLKFKKADKI